MSIKYHTIRKTSYDTLWHACYTVDGRETWDRIPELEALRLARELPPHLDRQPARERFTPEVRIAGHRHQHAGPVAQREDGPALGHFTTTPVPVVCDHLNVK